LLQEEAGFPTVERFFETLGKNRFALLHKASL